MKVYFLHLARTIAATASAKALSLLIKKGSSSSVLLKKTCCHAAAIGVYHTSSRVVKVNKVEFLKEMHELSRLYLIVTCIIILVKRQEVIRLIMLMISKHWQDNIFLKSTPLQTAVVVDLYYRPGSKSKQIVFSQRKSRLYWIVTYINWVKRKVVIRLMISKNLWHNCSTYVVR